MQAPSGQRAECGHGDADHWPHPERAARHHQVYHHLKLDTVMASQDVSLFKAGYSGGSTRCKLSRADYTEGITRCINI